MSTTALGFAYLPDYTYLNSDSGLNDPGSATGINLQLVVQLTDAGIELLETSKTLPILSYFVLADGHGYSPTQDQKALKGTTVFHAPLQAPTIDTGNYLIYSAQ